jgi:diguanylate cyclase (GGDEF)-like protein
MQAAPPARAPWLGARASTQITAQIRRFATAWVATALAVLMVIAATRIVTDGYRQSAEARAGAAMHAERAETRLQELVQREVNDRLAWEMSRSSTYVARLRRDSDATQQAASALLAAFAVDVGHTRVNGSAVARDVARWDARAAITFTPARGGHGPAAHPPAPSVDVQARRLEQRLVAMGSALDRAANTATAAAAHEAWQADMMRLLASVAGLVVLLVGGAVVLQKAWRMAVDADARGDREARWNQQVAAVVHWSSRAKAATTRSQLIGFGHMAPRDAIGAACLTVSEGSAAKHREHGLRRIVVPVDEAGEGLFVSVCFAIGRGDEIDHHSLDLMLGHLGALWRTVLRQEELEQAAGHDALTGLPNRRTFEAELRRRVGLSRRRGLGFTLAMVDLDHFKLVNDRFGHPEGDTVLRRVGEAIRSCLRGSDRVFRLGGEEFALLLETTDRDGVEELLQRARDTVRVLGVEPSPGVPISASIGWAVFPADAAERSALEAAADSALYRAKNMGRDRVERASAERDAA